MVGENCQPMEPSTSANWRERLSPTRPEDRDEGLAARLPGTMERAPRDFDVKISARYRVFALPVRCPKMLVSLAVET